MSLETGKFEFGEFTLDNAERALLHNGERVALTPKMFELLKALLSEPGKVFEKQELLDNVWPDSFVEEGNLSFTIRQLRKALGDDARSPKYIETIPRRGYRFIADVRPMSIAEKALAADESIPAIRPRPAPSPMSSRLVPIGLVAAFVAVLLGLGFSMFGGGKATAGATLLDEAFASELLTTNGKTYFVAFSPDGRKIAYVTAELEHQGVWIRDTSTAENIEIVAAGENVYGGIAFSPDGDKIYFARRPRFEERGFDIFRMSVSGGVPERVAEIVQGWFGISPDESLISYVRCPYLPEENCSLWVAELKEGGSERKLALRERPYRIADNTFSPDGRTIAFAAGQSHAADNDFRLMAFDLETGKERQLGKDVYFNIKSIVWLPNDSGLLFTARHTEMPNFRIWRLNHYTGESEPLTRDSETYSELAINADGRRLLATRVSRDFGLRFIDAGNPKETPHIADSIDATFAPNGKIVFSADSAGNADIWEMNPDGTGRKQLTRDPAADHLPRVSRDGAKIYFTSNRSGASRVWEMARDGSGQRQITHRDGGRPLGLSPDGEWLYFHSALNKNLWRVSLLSGDEQRILEGRHNYYALSPDGGHAVFAEDQAGRIYLAVIDLKTGEAVNTLQVSESGAKIAGLDWIGGGLIYILADPEFQNNTLYRISAATGKASSPIEITRLGNSQVNYLSASPDEKLIGIVQGAWRHNAILFTGLKY
jgi:Tol biopolymer transport system component/DNA-binding winged helix-turn-helix (wHTH) protein